MPLQIRLAYIGGVILVAILLFWVLNIRITAAQASVTWSAALEAEREPGDDEYGYELRTTSAFLWPDPSTVNFLPNGSWHRFVVNSSERVKVVANPGSAPLNVEINTNDSGSYCNNGAERNDTKTRSNGQTVYLAGCQSGIDTVELRHASTNALLGTYTFSIRSASIPTPTATHTPSPIPRTTSAFLWPDPSTVNFQPNGSWHRFTVNSSERVKVVANPGSAPLNVEINTNDSGSYCDNGAERNDTKTRSNRQTVYLAGCQSGTGTVELRHASTNALLQTYTFSIRSASVPTPTATHTPSSTPTATHTPSPTPTATHTPSSTPTATHTPSPTPAATHTPSPTPAATHTPMPAPCVNPLGILAGKTTHSSAWDSSCLSERNSRKYARFYTFSLNNRSDVQIDLTSSTDPYLYLMQGHGKNGTVVASNDDSNGKNSRIFGSRAPGNYTIEATTYNSGASGTFNLSINISTIAPATALDINVGLKVISNRGTNPSTPFSDFKWQIPESADVALTDIPAGVRASDYEYRIVAPQSTGIQVSRTRTTACDWSVSGSSWPGESRWTDAATGAVRLIRCGLGNAATGLTVQMREKSDHSNIDYNSYSTVVRHPWHIADNNITYAFASPLVVNATLLQQTIDRYKAATNQGAGKWNGAGTGMSFKKVSSTSSADVVVQGYYSRSGTDHCGRGNIACVVYGSGDTYPHFNRQMYLHFVYGREVTDAQGVTQTYTWTNDLVDATTRPGNYLRLYMPIYMAHEFGHAAGLWHTTASADAMAAVPNERPDLSNDDKKAMKAIYSNHSSH